MLKDADSQEEDRQVRLYEESGKFIAIYQWKEKAKKISHRQDDFLTSKRGRKDYAVYQGACGI
mgnify:CR=1 FL=1